MEKFDQYAHKEQYSLPRIAKLVGFVVVNEEKEDMLAFFDETDGILRSAYTKALSAALRFKTIEKAQDVIETLENLYSYLLSMKLKVNILLPAL